MLILGGGAAGLLLARHLERVDAALQIGVLDARALPGDPEQIRIGESLAEAASGYLEHQLDLGEHLRTHHVPKHGLRFFFSGESIGSRSEFASMRPGGGFWEIPFEGTNPPTFQLHRGRLEHHLAVTSGARLLGGRQVTKVERGRVHAGAEVFDADWVIDASGGSLVPLGERVRLDHAYEATWFWTERRVDPGELSDCAEFRSRTPRDLRWRSTTHLMGPGYWVWLIPVPGGGTSVGIVGPPVEDVQAWLADNEPELALWVGDIRPHRRSLRAWRRSAIVSDEGFGATGDAAVFLDPLYSSAFDLMAFANEFLVAAITGPERDRARTCRTANLLFERVVDQYLPMYSGMYELLGHPRVMAAKTAWDNAMYFGFVAPWLRSGEVADGLSFLRLRHTAERLAALQTRVQKLLRDWAAAEPPSPSAKHFDQSEARFLLGILDRLKVRHQGVELRRAMDRSLADLEVLAVALYLRAADSPPEGPINPYGIDLHDPSDLQTGRIRVRPRPAQLQDIARCWL